MKIEMNTIYHLPTQAHEDDFLKQAEKQGIEWAAGQKSTSKSYWNNGEYCIRTKEKYLAGHDSKSPYERTFPNLPIIEWKLGFTKADMQIGQLYKTRDNEVYLWLKDDEKAYDDNLCYSEFPSLGSCNDIMEVYPVEITPIWKRQELKEKMYKVNGLLTKDQAKKIGLDLCEVVE